MNNFSALVWVENNFSVNNFKVDIKLLEVGEYSVQVILDWYGIIKKPFTIVANGFDETLLSFINENSPEKSVLTK